ncbi:16S rRNA (cytosine(1402)-N(4))-methyltransferase RsmH [bacterium]|nr:16S rRNA (cytosine(1402)-N(4))-methyltransferase RsmH [bacterium]
MGYHEAVLLTESVEGLGIRPEGIYVDCTFGGGGHSRAILERLGPQGRLYAFDQDPAVRANLIDDPRFTWIELNFRHLSKGLRMHGVRSVDGILADFGVSSHQFDWAERGFSLRADGPLDMRMNPSAPRTAADVLAEADEAELRRIVETYAEIKPSGRLVRTLVQRRSSAPLTRTTELLELVAPLAPRGKEHQYAARVFQAFRIAVNDELGALSDLLEQTLEVLSSGGRLVCIAYHSLEDRMVKTLIREGRLGGEAERDAFGKRHMRFRSLSRKPIEPTAEEQERNPRSRSAKLRIAERIEAWI